MMSPSCRLTTLVAGYKAAVEGASATSVDASSAVSITVQHTGRRSADAVKHHIFDGGKKRTMTANQTVATIAFETADQLLCNGPVRRCLSHNKTTRIKTWLDGYFLSLSKRGDQAQHGH